MSFLPAIAPVIGMVAGAAGSIMQGMGAMQQGQYQAEIASRNAIVAKQNAAAALAAGNAKQQDQAMQQAAQMGKAKAVQGASGIDVNSGSAPLVLGGEAGLAGLDQSRIKQGSVNTAQNFIRQSQDFTAQAQIDKQTGTNAMFSSLLGGVNSVASKWSVYKQYGVM